MSLSLLLAPLLLAQSGEMIGGGAGSALNLPTIDRPSHPNPRRASKLIDAEREKRLSKIDAEAAKTQSDVEDAEKAYDARRQAAAAAAANANSDTSVTAPAASGGK